MQHPSVTISILAYKSRETIRDCVTSAWKLAYPGQIDILVREQGGDPPNSRKASDEEYQVLEELAATLPHSAHRKLVLTRGKNLGFAAGHNLHIRSSTSPFVLVLNADAVLMPQFLAEAMPAFEDERVGAVQGKLLRWDATRRAPKLSGNPEAPVIDTTGLLPLRNRRIINRGQGEVDHGQYDVADEVFGADGAAPLYRRAALDDTAFPQAEEGQTLLSEYFDESFFAYKEDVDLAWRMQWRGWKTRYIPTAVAWHSRGSGDSAAQKAWDILKERRKLSPRARYFAFVNQRLMQLKNESGSGLRRDLRPWLKKEVLAWGWALATEPRTFLPGTFRLLKSLPSTLRKRRYIMAHRTPGADPYQWFV